MAKVTPSMAKNQIKRSLLQIVDSHPNKVQKQQIWHYFDNKCAYCDIGIEHISRQGHLDHLLAVQDGGSNDVYNFVLACHICNGDEKRETPWREFLMNKCERLSESIYIERLAKIEVWQGQSIMSQIDAELLARMEAIIDKAKVNFDQSVEQMRALRDSITTN
ncbi:HNH endonuclease [Psychrobacter fozii]|uniref:HNH endonuclease n=1 Tax=Psychrobacter fozii TaxID=198480 RepID=UPI001919532B|nr:HNH endonuclease [Psychrobacter fozii]